MPLAEAVAELRTVSPEEFAVAAAVSGLAPALARSRRARVAACLAGCWRFGRYRRRRRELTVYVSLPLRGPSGPTAATSPTARGWRSPTPAARPAGSRSGRGTSTTPRARRAAPLDARRRRPPTPARRAEDSTAIAYLGDFDSGATRASLPITNGAKHAPGLAGERAPSDLVAALSGFDDELPETQPAGERTFGRVIPADDAQGAARRRVGRPARRAPGRDASSDGSRRSGGTMVGRFSRRARPAPSVDPAGRAARSTTAASPIPAAGGSRGRARLMVSDAELGPGAVEREPDGTLATSAALDPTQLPPARPATSAAEFGAEYGRAARPLRGLRLRGDGGDPRLDRPRLRPRRPRESVIDAFFDTADRDSVARTYSIDEVGDTTLDRMTGYRIIGGRRGPRGRAQRAVGAALASSRSRSAGSTLGDSGSA